MTISTNDLREEYTATASQTVFTFDFRVFADTDITVYQTPAGSAYDDSAHVITGYTVSRNANQDSSPGGSITLNTGATAGDRITIVSAVPESRTTDYQTGGSFDPNTVDNDFDRVVSIAKQASAKASRAMLSPESEQNAGSLILPDSTSRASKVLGFDSAGDPVATTQTSGVTGTELVGAIEDQNNQIIALYTVGATNSIVSKASGGSPAIGDIAISNYYDSNLTIGSGAKWKCIALGATPPDAASGINSDGYLYSAASSAAKFEVVGETVAAQQFGAVFDGSTDDSTAIVNAHASGKKVIYDGGDYLFAGTTNPSLSSDAEYLNGASVKGMLSENVEILQFDRSGALIGLMHNHREEKRTGTAALTPITTGVIVAPPEFTGTVETRVSVLAHWYNDWGRTYQENSSGSNKWYAWNDYHTDAVADAGASPVELGYQAKRHPILGWYRGDDANVVDWQCYWLLESGVSAIIPISQGGGRVIDDTNWQNDDDPDYWIYQLINNTKNGKYLSIIPWVDYGDFSNNFGNATALAEIESNWDDNISLIHESRQSFSTIVNGKRYFTVFCFDGESLRGDFDNYSGSTVTQAMLADRATYCQSLGYDGICILTRNSTTNATMNYGDLLNDGVLYVQSGYASSYTYASETSFATYVSNWSHDLDTQSIPSVLLDRESSGHPSEWDTAGSTPELFGRLVRKAVNVCETDKTVLPMMTVYNVAEWGEAGASLQPTVGNGWQYLDRLKKETSIAGRCNVRDDRVVMQTSYKPTGTITVLSDILDIQTDANATYSYTPMLTAGYDGQRLTIINTSSKVSGKVVTLDDDSRTSGTDLFFKNGESKRLDEGDTVDLIYMAAKGGWVEVGNELYNSKTYDWPSIAAGGTATTTLTVTGAALGDYVQASQQVDLQGMSLTAYVSATNTVTFVMYNPTAGAIDLGGSTLRARVIPAR